MAADREVTIHLTIDSVGHPVFAWVVEYDTTGEAHWLADQDFGPFDGWVDVARWAHRATKPHLAHRPG